MVHIALCIKNISGISSFFTWALAAGAESVLKWSEGAEHVNCVTPQLHGVSVKSSEMSSVSSPANSRDDWWDFPYRDDHHVWWDHCLCAVCVIGLLWEL